ncbi:MAG TPA: hypothetical protein VFL64_10355, partial [Rhizobacter sp.]|nr:hypothetical protein [Rhizobacter sp.]
MAELRGLKSPRPVLAMPQDRPNICCDSTTHRLASLRIGSARLFAAKRSEPGHEAEGEPSLG